MGLLHLWNDEFALQNGKPIRILNIDGQGGSIDLPPATPRLPQTVIQRIPGLWPVADEGFIRIRVVDQNGRPVPGVFAGVFSGPGWQEIENHGFGTFSDSAGNILTGVRFIGDTKTADVHVTLCQTTPTFTCSDVTVDHVTAGGIQYVKLPKGGFTRVAGIDPYNPAGGSVASPPSPAVTKPDGAPSPAAETPPATGATASSGARQRSSGEPLGKGVLMMTSPRAPSSYDPVSPRALDAARRMVRDSGKKLPGLEDQIRPHGDFQVITPAAPIP